MLEDFKRRFWLSLILTPFVLVLSPLIQSFLGISFRFTGDRFILFVLSSFIFIYGGWPFLKGSVEELKKKQPGMMTLIALAISVAYVYSGLVVFGLTGKVFFWELVTLIDVMLLGHWIEMRSVMGASRALEELARLMPSRAYRLTPEGSLEEVKVEDLKKGDMVLVKPGEKVPVDGRVKEGESEMDESMITGESQPIPKEKNNQVIGGSVNGTGSLTVEVNKTGEESYLSQVVELVKKAGESKSRVQDFANRAAFWLTLIAVTAGLATLFTWLIQGKEFVFSLERMVTVMVITCPHALGLAIPLVIAVVTALSAKNGLLIQNRGPFENSLRAHTVVFDKTGTLTRGEFGVTDVISLGDWSEEELLKKAASVEAHSEHTIAKGIVQKAQEEKINLEKLKYFQALPGKGTQAELGGNEILVGNKRILEKSGRLSGKEKQEFDEMSSQGKTVVFVVSNGKIQGIIALADMIRDESREAVKELRKIGMEVAMITGDNQPTAAFVAKELGIKTFFYEVLPDQKSEKIKALQNQSKKVAMVGDGVNDAPALVQADVGIAIGAGTDVAVESADVILVENDPRGVVDVLQFSRITRRKMKQNLAWATGYNVVAIPLAAGVLYNWGILLSPAVGALVMSLSTVIVAFNARLISYKKREQGKSISAPS
ncbi:heavy metal translocating P-type ATPase [bacterium]|nr:heavy metal translocating P-type ATPase [bacterium]